TTAPDDDHIRLGGILHELQRLNDRWRGEIALYQCRGQSQLCQWVAAMDDSLDIVPDRAALRCHHTDPQRQCWEWSLAGFVEEPFGLEAHAQLFQLQLKQSGALWLHEVYLKLHLATGLVHGDAS